MYILSSFAWGGPGTKWIKTDDGWRECIDGRMDDLFHIIKDTNKDSTVNPSFSSNLENYKEVTDNSNFEKGMWIRVAPKVHREVAGYDSFGNFLRKLHLFKAGEELGPFNYMIPLMELIIKRELPQLCRSSRLLLFRVIGDMVSRVLRTSEYIHEMKALLRVFQQGIAELESCFVSLTQSKKDIQCIEEWIKKLDEHEVPQRQDEGASLIDMPLEVLQLVVSFLDKDRDVESLSHVHDELRDLCHEEKQWKIRCYRHFSESDIDELIKTSTGGHVPSWKDVYLHATNTFTIKNPKNRCLLHCKTCGLMFWNGYGHPCLPKSTATYEPVSPEELLYYFS